MDVQAGLDLIASCYTGLAVSLDAADRVKLIEEGWSSWALDIADRYIFRFPRRPEILANQQFEARLLPLLAERLPLRVSKPEYLHLDDPDYRRCFFGYTKIPGQALSADLTRSPKIARQVGQFLATLHTTPQQVWQDAGMPLKDARDWRQGYQEFYAWIEQYAWPEIERHGSGGGPQTRLYWQQRWESFLADQANFTFTTALIHGDLGAEHILCDAQTEQVNGIIDWEDARAGDPALDFVGLFGVGGADFVKNVMKAYQEAAPPSATLFDDTFWSRVLFYWDIIPFYEFQFALLTQDTGRFNHSLEELHSSARDRGLSAIS